jgi:hypothetical protein
MEIITIVLIVGAYEATKVLGICACHPLMVKVWNAIRKRNEGLKELKQDETG